MKRRASGVLLALLVALFALPVAALLLAALLPADAATAFIDSGGLAFRHLTGLSLDQVRDVLADRQFRRMFANSARIALCALLPSLPISFLAGLLLARARLRGQRVLHVLYALALLLPFQTIMLPAYKISLWTNTYDSVLSVAALAAFSPLGPLVMAVLISGIPDEQWEAASLDANSLSRVLAHIVLPQVLPGTAALALITFAEAWNMVEQPLILLSAASGTQPLSLTLNDIAKSSAGFGLAGAALYALPVLVIYGLAAAGIGWRMLRGRKAKNARPFQWP